MKIRKKIILFFTVTAVILTGVVLLFIYQFFAAYREEAFQQRLKDKMTFSLKFLDEVEQTSQSLLNHLNRMTINDLYDEKMLLFNGNKHLIYASLDDTKIFHSASLLKRLSPEVTWLEMKEGDSDVIGRCFKVNGKDFYGLYKAYDQVGYTQLRFLKYVLWFGFAMIAIITWLITLYLSKQIASSINKMAKEIGQLEFDDELGYISVPDTKDEINFLAIRFNEMMARLQHSFTFQKHAVNHISHELKTPIAVLVSNFEKMEREGDPDKLKKLISWQKEYTKNLGDTINALLEISKLESGQKSVNTPVRIDELLWDILENLKELHNDFNFQLHFDDQISGESELTVYGNQRLLTSVFLNLAINCIHFSTESVAHIELANNKGKLAIVFKNRGTPILPEERKFLFKYFFRGHNSQGRRGFGLGLVMVHRIVQLYHGSIDYENPETDLNIFRISLPVIDK